MPPGIEKNTGKNKGEPGPVPQLIGGVDPTQHWTNLFIHLFVLQWLLSKWTTNKPQVLGWGKEGNGKVNLKEIYVIKRDEERLRHDISGQTSKLRNSDTWSKLDWYRKPPGRKNGVWKKKREYWCEEDLYRKFEDGVVKIRIERNQDIDYMKNPRRMHIYCICICMYIFFMLMTTL